MGTLGELHHHKGTLLLARMLPTRHQFRKWSYPSKFGFVSFFIGLTLSIAFWLFPDAGKQLVAYFSPSIDQNLIGTWQGVTRYEAPGSEIIQSGHTRLLETGQYEFSGTFELRLPKHLTLPYAVLATGTWKTIGDKMVITASDLKSTFQGADPVLRQLAPKLEDVLPRGASQEYTITELTATRLQARGDDIRGNPVSYEATKSLLPPNPMTTP